MQWIAFKSSKYNHAYYYNQETGEVQWEKPRFFPKIFTEYPPIINIKSEISETTGNEYFFNQITGESTWKSPTPKNNFTAGIYRGLNFWKITETFKDDVQLYGTVMNMCPTGIMSDKALTNEDEDIEVNLGLIKYNNVAVAIIVWIEYDECIYIDSVCSSKIITKWESRDSDYPKEWHETLQSNIEVTDALSTYMGAYLVWVIVSINTGYDSVRKPVVLQDAARREGYYESMGFKVTKHAELLGKCHVHKKNIKKDKLMVFDGDEKTLSKNVEENMAKFFKKFSKIMDKDFVMDITSVFFWGDGPCGRKKPLTQSDVDKANLEFDKMEDEDPDFIRPRLYPKGCYKGLGLADVISDWAIDTKNPKILAITQGKLGMFKGK
jgi:hypothetical protein